MRKWIITYCICLFVNNGFAQIDSLLRKYQSLDSIHTQYYRDGTGDNTEKVGLEMVRIALQLKNDSMIARGYNILGGYYALVKGDYSVGLEYFFKGIPYAEKEKNGYSLPSLYCDISVAYSMLGSFDQQAVYLQKAEASLPDSDHPGYNYLQMQIRVNSAFLYLYINQPDRSLQFINESAALNKRLRYQAWDYFIETAWGKYYDQKGDTARAMAAFQRALAMDEYIKVPWARFVFMFNYIDFLLGHKRYDLARPVIDKLQEISREDHNDYFRLARMRYLKKIFEDQQRFDSAYAYSKLEAALSESVFNQQTINRVQALTFNEEIRLKQEAEERRRKIRTNMVIAGFAIILLIALILYRNNLQRKRANRILQKTLSDLKATQSQLIQSEKMASLGELTAGIAHEIQNPLNFVNNFSEVNKEMIAELKEEINKGNYDEVKTIADDIEANEEKIIHHGKRADAIVKGMLQHSRTSNGQKEPSDINALCDEYLRLAYHGLRAKDKSFNATMKTDFDANIGNINIVPMEFGRVILNLINNAFYAVSEKKKLSDDNYEPTVTVSTKRQNEKVEIKVADNGTGIPQKVLEKIFQPFFTTKPTGQGTGLGLSLSYDIVKAHSGELLVETKEGDGTEFKIIL